MIEGTRERDIWFWRPKEEIFSAMWGRFGARLEDACKPSRADIGMASPRRTDRAASSLN